VNSDAFEVPTGTSGLSFSDAAGFRVVALLSLKVFPFEQTHLDNARQILRLNRVVRWAITMTVPKNDKFKDYARYAEHCLNMVAATRDQESRRIQREMAVEWLRLADTIRRPRRFKQMQKG
jgi:hypothetical protein